jgi:hypothetical protein
VCTSEYSLRSCDGERWVVTSCADECAAIGLQRSWGCFDATEGGTCVCDPESTACSPVGTNQCYDGVNGRSCLEDGWAALDGDFICERDGLSSTTDCALTEDGYMNFICTQACEEGAMFCESRDTPRYCSNGFYEGNRSGPRFRV